MVIFTIEVIRLALRVDDDSITDMRVFVDDDAVNPAAPSYPDWRRMWVFARPLGLKPLFAVTNS